MSFLSGLNPQQRDAAETIHGPVLILAGAGTGKTRVITHRVAHMVQSGIDPGNILGVTFTNKAAREMQERISKLLPKVPKGTPKEDQPEKATICTFHSLCVRILRVHIGKLGYKPSFVIFDESDQLSAIKKILSTISATGEKTDPNAILSLLSRYRNGGAKSAAFDDPSVAALAEHIRKKYESALRACNAVDFDDLILLTLKLFTEHPDALEACRLKYRYIMVDEYQDTNASQFQLVHALAKEHRNFCVVGDDDQSIYGWRGAEVANLLNLEQHFPEVKVVKLEQNYRSTPTILNAANAVIKNNARRRPKQLWSDKGPGTKIVLHTFPNDEEEAKTLADQIEFNRVGHRIPWGEQAILFRTNQQARPIETALRKAGIRYHLIGGQSYYDRREIRDLLAYLKMMLNPHDDVSLLRIANTPARGLSDVTMERLLAASHERDCSVFATMRHTDVLDSLQPRTRDAVAAFVAFVERVHAPLEGKEPVALRQWAMDWLAETGYCEDIRKLEKDPEAGDNRVSNVHEVIAQIDGGEVALPDGEGRLATFLEELSLDHDRKNDKEPDGESVTLITMHSCKGLEYPHVFIVGLEDGLLPHARSKVEGTMDEERRLFYVAITRAMKSLTITHCTGRKRYGQLFPCQSSPFLQELPSDLVEHADSAQKKNVVQSEGLKFFEAMKASLGGE
jgi:DNA helicase II / ATP-dependent DNA helicase PcrA